MDKSYEKITARLKPEAQRAVEKIMAAKNTEFWWITITDVVNMALVGYAKTLPDPPKADAPEKMG